MQHNNGSKSMNFVIIFAGPLLIHPCITLSPNFDKN